MEIALSSNYDAVGLEKKVAFDIKFAPLQPLAERPGPEKRTLKKDFRMRCSTGNLYSKSIEVIEISDEDN